MAAGSRPVPLAPFVALRSISRSPRKTSTLFITVELGPEGSDPLVPRAGASSASAVRL